MLGIIRSLEFRIKTILLIPVPLRDEFVMVTGADRTHFKSLCNLLRSVEKWEPGMRCIVYDLGLDPDQRSALAAAFPAREVRRFDYSKYPEYFNIRINAGEYAWKPVIFSEVFEECRCSVGWFDAGNLLTGPLTHMRKVVQWQGFYSPFAKPHVADWTHPGTLAYLNVEKWIYTKTNLAGYCVAANFRSSKARVFVERWRQCALVKECIAPEGSNRYNHRQDMSVLSILAYQIGLPLLLSRFLLGFKSQQDVD
ncbi:MAG: DUF1647 domain-containing protein [Anaerolineales bacterium]